jgi:hypothetical protein
MFSSDSKFYNQTLWESTDSLKSANYFRGSMYIVKDNYGVSATKMQIQIGNFKNKISNSITFNYQEVFKYLLKLKPIIENGGISKVYSLPESHSIVCKIGQKNFITIFCKTVEYGDTVLLVVSSKGEDFLDSEKFYCPICEFLSLSKILILYRDTYPTLAINMGFRVDVQGIQEQVNDLTQKVNSLYQLGKSISSCPSPVVSEKFDVESFIGEDELIPTEVQDGLNNFINDNFDKIEIEEITISEKETSEKKDRDASAVDRLSDSFSKNIVKNDIQNLDDILTMIPTSKTPYHTFMNLLLPGCPDNEVESKLFQCLKKESLSLIYGGSLYLKSVIQKYLSEKVAIPSVFPFRFDVKAGIYYEDNIELMKSLYAYIVYYTIVCNQLKQKSTIATVNKELQLFVLKVIASPFVFSYMDAVDTKQLIISTINKLTIYRDSGIFSNFEKDIIDKFNITIDVNDDAISKIVTQMCSVIKKKWNDISATEFLSKMKSMKITAMTESELIGRNIVKFSAVYDCVNLELDKDNKNVSLDNKDVPDELLSDLGLKDKKYNNSNLKRFISDNLKEDVSLGYTLDIVSKIKMRFTEVENIDWSKINDIGLKAIRVWNPTEDPKMLTNYFYFKQLVDDCKLNRPELLSLLTDNELEKVGAEDYSNVFDLEL